VTLFLILFTLNAAIPNGASAQNRDQFSAGLGSLANYAGDVSRGFIHGVPELGIETAMERVHGQRRASSAWMRFFTIVRMRTKNTCWRTGSRACRVSLAGAHL
jgi:hypothetical protein